MFFLGLNLQLPFSWVRVLWILNYYASGLAGIRVGYGAFPSSIIEFLWRAKQPYNVSVAAEISACAALKNSAYLEVSELLIYNCRDIYNVSYLPSFNSKKRHIRP